MLKSAIRLFLIGLSFSACSDDDSDRVDKTDKDDAEIISRYCPGVYAGRTILDSLERAEGTVFYSYRAAYVIRELNPESSEHFLDTLVPCNLEEEFKEEGLKVEVSGYVLELPELPVVPDVLGHAFIITEIKLIND